jgi:hypothetical protein
MTTPLSCLGRTWPSGCQATKSISILTAWLSDVRHLTKLHLVQLAEYNTLLAHLSENTCERPTLGWWSFGCGEQEEVDQQHAYPMAA